jgi:hypothetical protein
MLCLLSGTPRSTVSPIVTVKVHTGHSISWRNMSNSIAVLVVMEMLEDPIKALFLFFFFVSFLSFLLRGVAQFVAAGGIVNVFFFLLCAPMVPTPSKAAPQPPQAANPASRARATWFMRPHSLGPNPPIQPFVWGLPYPPSSSSSSFPRAMKSTHPSKTQLLLLLLLFLTTWLAVPLQATNQPTTQKKNQDL